jgi:hypothetical protein
MYICVSERFRRQLIYVVSRIYLRATGQHRVGVN